SIEGHLQRPPVVLKVWAGSKAPVGSTSAIAPRRCEGVRSGRGTRRWLRPSPRPPCGGRGRRSGATGMAARQRCPVGCSYVKLSALWGVWQAIVVPAGAMIGGGAGGSVGGGWRGGQTRGRRGGGR